MADQLLLQVLNGIILFLARLARIFNGKYRIKLLNLQLMLFINCSTPIVLKDIHEMAPEDRKALVEGYRSVLVKSGLISDRYWPEMRAHLSMGNAAEFIQIIKNHGNFSKHGRFLPKTIDI